MLAGAILERTAAGFVPEVPAQDVIAVTIAQHALGHKPLGFFAHERTVETRKPAAEIERSPSARLNRAAVRGLAPAVVIAEQPGGALSTKNLKTTLKTHLAGQVDQPVDIIPAELPLPRLVPGPLRPELHRREPEAARAGDRPPIQRAEVWADGNTGHRGENRKAAASVLLTLLVLLTPVFICYNSDRAQVNT